MTNSFQSTAFRSSAAPVETFVQQPRVLPKTNTEELADILKVVNPGIQKYLGLQLQKEADAAASKAINDALDDSTENFAETTKFLKSNEMIGGNIFYDKVYRRTKATILGGTIETNLKNSYKSTDIDGIPLSNFSLDSEEYQNWFRTEKNKVIDLLGDVDEDTFSKKFMPYLVNATNTMNDFHLKEHKAFQVDRLNTEAVGLAHSLIELNAFNPNADEFSKQKFNLFLNSINQFENDINKLGLSTADRSKLNKTILDSAADKAREIGYQTGDSDIALKIFDSINLFPYGSSGKLNLTNHPDYIDKRLELLEKVESYTASKDSRDAAKIKRLKEKNLSDGMFTAAKLFQAGEGEEANNLIEELKINNPLLAAKIDSNVAALDGDTLERYAIMLENITSGNVYDTLADARTAVVSWFLDERTPKSPGNISKLNKLMTLTGSVDKGLLEPLNSYFTIYNDHSKSILQTDEKFQIYAKINKEKQLALQKLNFEAFKTEFREWKLESGDVGQEAINNKYKELKKKYDDQLLEDMNELINPSSEQDGGINKQIIGDNQSGLEGVPTDKDQQGDFFGNTNLPPRQREVIKTLEEMGGITTENANKLISQYKGMLENMPIGGAGWLTGTRANILQDIKFLETGEYGFGFGGPKVYEPMKKLIGDATENIEAGAFTEGGKTTFEVESGDTLSGIANDLDTSVEAIKKANGLTSDTIQIGETLVIPEGITDLDKVNAPKFDINKLITEKDHPFKPVRQKHNFQVIYNLAKKNGIKFPEVVAAQFGVESVYGSKVTGTNNYFGIKADQKDIRTGNFTEADTFEEIDGKMVKVRAKFKNFKTLEESIQHYKKFWNDDFQDRKGIINVNSLKEAIIRLKENGYATDSDYVKLVTDVLNDAINNKFF